MKKSIYNFSKILILLLIVGLSSCGQDTETKPDNKTLLTAHKWALKTEEIDGMPIDNTGEIYEYTDNGILKIFDKDGKHTSSDTWTLKEDIITDGEGKEMTILKLEENELKMKGTINKLEDGISTPLDHKLYFEKN